MPRILPILLLCVLTAACAHGTIRPQDMVDLGVRETSVGNTQDMTGATPDGANTGVFAVPDGWMLVITSLKTFPTQPGEGCLWVPPASRR